MIDRHASYKKQTNMIKRLILKHHENRGDLVCLECRNGDNSVDTDKPTKTRCKIMDAWAWERRYNRLRTWGYEIKVSLSDFKGDYKWRDYLPYCTYFYFVTPQGLITLDQIPAEAGWIEASKNFKKLLTRKRPPKNNIEEPIGVYKYLLSQRAQIDNKYTGWNEYFPMSDEFMAGVDDR